MNELYLDDSYLKDFEAVVKSVKEDKFVVLDKTAFYPNGGGQPYDTGKIGDHQVVFVGKFDGNISHELASPGLKEGDEVKCTIDWERRYKLMRSHTAAHILSAVFHKEASALITGNQLGLDKSRIDFNLEDFDREKMDEYFKIANELVEKDLPVTVSYMSREEADSDQTMFKLAKALPESIKTIRVVAIGDYDRQADGGTHVKSLKEVGPITFIKAENKGKNNRRVYFSL
jgi:misacylated tRNA(Ala) deacylase